MHDKSQAAWMCASVQPQASWAAGRAPTGQRSSYLQLVLCVAVLPLHLLHPLAGRPCWGSEPTTANCSQLFWCHDASMCAQCIQLCSACNCSRNRGCESTAPLWVVHKGAWERLASCACARVFNEMSAQMELPAACGAAGLGAPPRVACTTPLVARLGCCRSLKSRRSDGRDCSWRPRQAWAAG